MGAIQSFDNMIKIVFSKSKNYKKLNNDLKWTLSSWPPPIVRSYYDNSNKKYLVIWYFLAVKINNLWVLITWHSMITAQWSSTEYIPSIHLYTITGIVLISKHNIITPLWLPIYVLYPFLWIIHREYINIL